MEIKIGIQHIQREIFIETDESAAEVHKAVEAAISKGGLLTLNDTKGRTVTIPGSAVGYVEIGAENARRVGFGAA